MTFSIKRHYFFALLPGIEPTEKTTPRFSSMIAMNPYDYVIIPRAAHNMCDLHYWMWNAECCGYCAKTYKKTKLNMVDE